jgi:hypothetical protein
MNVCAMGEHMPEFNDHDLIEIIGRVANGGTVYPLQLLFGVVENLLACPLTASNFVELVQHRNSVLQR